MVVPGEPQAILEIRPEWSWWSERPDTQTLAVELVPLVLSGEIDEVVAYRPEVREAADRVRAEVDAAWESLRVVWERSWRIEGQGDFARAVVGATPFSGLLFALRRRHGAEQSEARLWRLWLDSPEEIAKALLGRGRR